MGIASVVILIALVAAAIVVGLSGPAPAPPPPDKPPLDPAERSRTAAHEAAHALVAWLSPWAGAVIEVAIVNRGHIAGETSYYAPPRTLEGRCDEAAVKMAGLAGVLVAYGRFATMNGEQDIVHAAEIVRSAMREHGIDPVLRRLPPAAHGPDFSRWLPGTEPHVARAINGAFAKARSEIHGNRSRFDRLRDAIDQRGRLSRRDLKELLGDRPWAIGQTNRRRA